MSLAAGQEWKAASRHLAASRGQLTKRINEGERTVAKLATKADTLDAGLTEFTDANAICKAIAEVLRKVEDQGAEIAAMCEDESEELRTLNNGLASDQSRADTARDKIITATDDYLRRQRELQSAAASAAAYRAGGEEGTARGNVKDVAVAKPELLNASSGITELNRWLRTVDAWFSIGRIDTLPPRPSSLCSPSV